MTTKLLSTLAVAALLASLSATVSAQNVAIVNGKAVPQSRVEALSQQVARSGRQVTPEIQAQIKDEVIAREIFIQEAQKMGMDSSEDFKTQMNWLAKPF
jgi:peptidyl-prolyl cis-trans isomerase C